MNISSMFLFDCCAFLTKFKCVCCLTEEAGFQSHQNQFCLSLHFWAETLIWVFEFCKFFLTHWHIPFCLSQSMCCNGDHFLPRLWILSLIFKKRIWELEWKLEKEGSQDMRCGECVEHAAGCEVFACSHMENSLHLACWLEDKVAESCADSLKAVNAHVLLQSHDMQQNPWDSAVSRNCVVIVSLQIVKPLKGLRILNSCGWAQMKASWSLNIPWKEKRGHEDSSAGSQERLVMSAAFLWRRTEIRVVEQCCVMWEAILRVCLRLWFKIRWLLLQSILSLLLSFPCSSILVCHVILHRYFVLFYESLSVQM